MVKINDVKFSDIYVTPDKKAFVPDGKTRNGLAILEAEDFEEFYKQLEDAWDGDNPSYSLLYDGIFYRIERTMSIYGPQYCGRKMPKQVPPLSTLGFIPQLTNYLTSLANASGLILWAGPTGQGKTTSLSSLMKEYLQSEGGFAYTIEDPCEMPLDGVYHARKGGLGLCKQNIPPNGDWGAGLKSALRSKPRYILVGEIRTPETASEALRAATSGHLVISTIHANNVTDAVNALVKYSAATGISEDMAYDLVGNGLLVCLHQILYGAPKRAMVNYLFANPDTTKSCQVRGMIRSGKLNLATILEQQRIKMEKGIPLFGSTFQ